MDMFVPLLARGRVVLVPRVAGDRYSFLRLPLVAEIGTSILKWHDGSEQPDRTGIDKADD